MSETNGNWLDGVDFAREFPGEPLVPVGVPLQSPFTAAANRNLTAFLGDEKVYVDRHELETALLERGPEHAEALWRKALAAVPKDEARTPIMLREYQRGSNSYGYGYSGSGGHWSSVLRLPSMVGLSPVSAALYLAAVGRLDQPVPLKFARALLDPQFRFPDQLSSLADLAAPEPVCLRGLRVDGEHQLVFGGHDKRRDPFSGDYIEVEKGEDDRVLSQGWRRIDESIFYGHPSAEDDDDDDDEVNEVAACQEWTIDHDGSRLVRLDPRPLEKPLETTLPVAELADILPEVAELLEDVRRDPEGLWSPALREAHWSKSRPGACAVAKRIVEGALLEFAPWPHPFRLRTEEELRLTRREIIEQIRPLFDRLLDAPQPLRPSDLTSYFLSLIDRQRAEFTPWPEALACVWGFKIKTGDHNWIEGRIWHEPDRADDLRDPVVEFMFGAILLQQRRHKDRYRHIVRLDTGSLRCFIHRDDT